MGKNDLVKLVKEICPEGDWYIFDIQKEGQCLYVGNVKSKNNNISDIKITEFLKCILKLQQRGYDTDKLSVYQVFENYQKIIFEEKIKILGMSVVFAGPNIYIK